MDEKKVEEQRRGEERREGLLGETNWTLTSSFVYPSVRSIDISKVIMIYFIYKFYLFDHFIFPYTNPFRALRQDTIPLFWIPHSEYATIRTCVLL